MIKTDAVLDFENLTSNYAKRRAFIIQDIRHEFNSLIEGILRMHKDSIDWVLSSLISREPEYGLLFNRCCNLELIKWSIENNANLKKIILYDRTLYKIVRARYASNQKIDIECRWSIKSSSVYFYFRNLCRSVSIISMILIAKIISKQNKIKSTSRPLTLVTTHILKDSKQEYSKEKYIDRYYPDLFNYLDDSIAKNLVFVPGFPGGLRNYTALFKKLKASNINFLLKSDILHISDYFYVFFHAAKPIFRKVPSVYFKGVDISKFLRSELISFSSDYKIIDTLLNHRFAFRLSNSGLNVPLLVDWYENQLPSKGIMLGFNTYMSNTRTIGYHGIIDSAALRLNLHPTTFDRKYLLTPKEIFVTGSAMVKHMKEFDKNIDISIGPSFRYNYLWDIEKTSSRSMIILVSLPILVRESIIILKLLHSVLKLIDTHHSCKFLVKHHPTHTESNIKHMSFLNDERVKYVDGAFSEYIASTDLLISGASTTCIEAMSLGISVAIHGSESEIINNSIPDSIPKNLYNIIKSKHELLRLIEELLHHNSVVYNNTYIKEQYFRKVDKISVLALFKG
jgi:hypothetical protein